VHGNTSNSQQNRADERPSAPAKRSWIERARIAKMRFPQREASEEGTRRIMNRQSFASIVVLCAWLGFVSESAAEEDPFQGVGSITVPLEKMKWRKQAPDLPQKISMLWGNRDRDGGFGELVELPPGFRSPLHAHSGDFHGVLIKGAWLHEDASGKGTPVTPGSYVRQAGGEMHVDRCVSKEPCLLFLFQYARADVILAK
jgi:hypothetical protein